MDDTMNLDLKLKIFCTRQSLVINVALTNCRQVELFTPGNETTVMILCDVEIKHVGSSLSGADGQVISDTAVTLEAKTTDSYDVRVVLKDNKYLRVCNTNTCTATMAPNIPHAYHGFSMIVPFWNLATSRTLPLRVTSLTR